MNIRTRNAIRIIIGFLFAVLMYPLAILIIAGYIDLLRVAFKNAPHLLVIGVVITILFLFIVIAAAAKLSLGFKKKQKSRTEPPMSTLDRINLIVFYCLAISGFCIVFGFMFDSIYPEVEIFGRIGAIAVIPGWFSGASAVILFLIGASLFLLGRMENYWNSLYPLNLGLTFLGLCFIAYNPNQHPLVWIFIAVIFAILVSVSLHGINIVKHKWFLSVLTVLLFIYDWWSAFTGAVIFVFLSFLSGASKKIWYSTKSLNSHE